MMQDLSPPDWDWPATVEAGVTSATLSTSPTAITISNRASLLIGNRRNGLCFGTHGNLRQSQIPSVHSVEKLKPQLATSSLVRRNIHVTLAGPHPRC